MAQTFNYPLNLASSVASTVSSIFIPTNATIGNVLYNTLTVGNMLSNNLNLGSVSMFSGSFSASNNQVSAANVSGLIFSNSNVNYFEIILTVGITTSIPSTINAVYTIRGNYNASGWALAVSYIGDTTGITFSINSVTGQISYTSTNISFWTSDIFRYRVEQITSTGTYTSLIAGATTSNYSFSTLQILSTTDALPNNNIGALQVAGGVTISKELFVGGSSFFNTTGSLGINTTNISYNLDVNGTLRVNNTLLATFNSNTIGNIFTTGGNVGINTISPGFTLDVSGTGRFTSSITTSNVFSTNITSTNLVSSFTSLGNLTSSTGTFANKVGGSQTVGTIVVTTSASLIGNTNTIGNLFTTGGNVGINTVSPIYTLDITGTSRISTKLDIGGTQPNFNNSTLGTLFLTGSGVSGILMNTTQDIYPTYQLGNLGHDNIVKYFDMYYDGNANRASSSTGSFIISKNLNRLNFITFASGSAGSILASQNYSMVIGSTGNVGINQTSPAFTLDVSGSTRITNSLLATFNSNTLGSLFTSGGNVSITGNLSATGLNTSSIIVTGGVGISGNTNIGGTITSGNTPYKIWLVTGTFPASTGTVTNISLPSGCSPANVISVVGVTNNNSNGDWVPFNYDPADSSYNISYYIQSANTSVSLINRGAYTPSRQFRVTIMTFA